MGTRAIVNRVKSDVKTHTAIIDGKTYNVATPNENELYKAQASLYSDIESDVITPVSGDLFLHEITRLNGEKIFWYYFNPIVYLRGN